MDIDELRAFLWKKVREHQAGGGKVRNAKMAEAFGGERGYYHDCGDPLSTVCLLGAAGVASGGYTSVEKEAAALLGITQEEADMLESGFEDFDIASLSNPRHLSETELVELPHYKLGKEIADQLFLEEANVQG